MFGGALDGVESARVTQSTRARSGAVSDGRPRRPNVNDKTLMVRIGPVTSPIYKRLVIGLGAALVIALAVLATTLLQTTARPTAAPTAAAAEAAPGPEPSPVPQTVAVPDLAPDPTSAPEGGAPAVSEVQNPAAGPTAQPGTLVKLREASRPASESSVKPKRKRTRRRLPAQPSDGAWNPNALFPEK
ncbi:MAG: hypothetical protein H0T89_35375 [Deltaproteobacteria bacterium]|nr:hypothetical protein [Deltaproteobacteria bacterium]MDQ3301572.1 hypothetical protein [Myxococcota bacterium]